MQPGRHLRHAAQPRNIHRPAGLEHIAPAQRCLAHTADMPLEVPSGHEFGHHPLATDLRMPHRQRPGLAECLRQLRRQHQVTQAQRREGDLAEGADVQHPPLPVECCKRGQGRAAVTVLAVVVVFDDPAIAALSPAQQFQTTRQAHGHPGRVLVGRRDIGQPAIP
ncbi:hypothetical protein D3C81_1408000 [compost metagenome]